MEVIRLPPSSGQVGRPTDRKTKRLSGSSVDTAAEAQGALADLGFAEDIVKNLTLPPHKPSLQVAVEPTQSPLSPSSSTLPEEPSSPNPPNSHTSWDSNSVSAELFQRSDSVAGSRTGKRLYPDVPVFSNLWSPREFQERFDFVVTELKRAVDEHPQLRDRARFINYWLCMCGTCPSTATPSIVVFCEKAAVGQLRDLFKRKAKDRLYCGKNSKLYHMFKEHRPPRPPFNLVYYRTDAEPLHRRSADIVLHPRLQPSGSFCGTLVKNGTSSATLGITLQIDNHIRALTVGHLFSNFEDDVQRLPDTNAAEHHDDGSSTVAGDTLNDQEVVTLNSFWVDDSDFDSEDESDDTMASNSSIPEKQSRLVDEPPDADDTVWLEIDPTTWLQVGTKLNLPTTPQPTDANLDYSLITLKDDHSKLPNSFAPPDRLGELVPLEKVATSVRSHRTKIYMISGASGIRDGTLLRGDAFVGSNPGQKMCRTWMVILDGPMGVIDGDCGSVIVDQETHEVYGHVIGSNPLNHAHIVPLMDTIEQIKLRSGASEVDLPQVFVFPKTELAEAPPTAPQPTRRNLKDRDHIFLIDDSASMRPHWRKAIALFQVLGNLANYLGGRHLEVHFPTSEEVHQATETEPLIRRMKEFLADWDAASRPTSRSDRSLKDIFSSHHSDTSSASSTRPSTPSGSRSKAKQPGQQGQQTTVYIFTDGIWGQDTNIGLALRNILTSLQAQTHATAAPAAHAPAYTHVPNTNTTVPAAGAGAPPPPASTPASAAPLDIQFIHFGNACHLAEYVRNIDLVRDRLAYPVAFETAGGNRLKMLLGTSLEQRSGRRCPAIAPSAAAPAARVSTAAVPGAAGAAAAGAADGSGPSGDGGGHDGGGGSGRSGGFLKRKRSAGKKLKAGKDVAQAGWPMMRSGFWMGSGGKQLECARTPVCGVA